MSIDRRMGKEDVVCIHIYIYIYIGILLSHKKCEMMPFATTWIDLEIITPNEVSQTEKDR